MKLGTRIALLTTVAVALTLIAASVFTYFAARSSLLSQTDSFLQESLVTIMDRMVPVKHHAGVFADPKVQQEPGLVETIAKNGRARQLWISPAPQPPVAPIRRLKLPTKASNLPPPNPPTSERTPNEGKARKKVRLSRDGYKQIPVTARTRQILALGRGHEFGYTTSANGYKVRVYVVGRQGGGAVRIIQPLRLSQVEEQLTHLRKILIIVSLAGIILALVLGWLIARSSLRPIKKLTQTAETVATTHDLGQRIESHSNDELGRLAKSFNHMLGEIDEVNKSQRQLISDASHELRTPLTSLKTNIEYLGQGAQDEGSEHSAVQADMFEQVNELTGIVTNLISLARGDQPALNFEDVDLAEVARDALKREQRDFPSTQFESRLESNIVQGDREQLQLAVTNLLDNGAKWSPRGTTVELTVDQNGVSVRDHGEGFPEQDIDHVFDRFYRSSSARNMPGSGLGLAIVKQVAEAHNAKVTAQNASDGGAIVTITFS